MTHLSQNLQLPENTLPSAPSTDSTEMTRSGNNSSSSSSSSSSKKNEKRYKGIRRRKWGKWASEIRVPKTRNRLWLGTYFSQEAAAMAHDTAVFCLRGTSAAKSLNFPDCIPAFLPSNLSPRSVQKAALDAGAAIDAGLASSLPESNKQATETATIQAGERLMWDDDDYNWSNVYQPSELGEDGSLNISVDDMEIYM